MENFANYNAEWIRKNGNRWEKDGQVRYYFNNIWRVFDLIGVEYEFHKTGAVRYCSHYSNAEAKRMSYRIKEGVYFDATSGGFFFKNEEMGPIVEKMKEALAQ